MQLFWYRSITTKSWGLCYQSRNIVHSRLRIKYGELSKIFFPLNFDPMQKNFAKTKLVVPAGTPIKQLLNTVAEAH